MHDLAVPAKVWIPETDPLDCDDSSFATPYSAKAPDMNRLSSPNEIEMRLRALRAAHRALDARIEQLLREGYTDQVQIQRLKKQKLALKDRIATLERMRLPDITA